MKPKEARFIIRAAGAVVVLVSVFLGWLSIPPGGPGPTNPSLAEMAGLSFANLQVTSLQFTLVAAILIVLGALASFRHELGAIPVLAGVGYFLYVISTTLGEFFAEQGVSAGIGPFVAIAGAAVIFAAAIPQVLPWAKKRKKLAGAVLAVVIVAATGYVLFLNFTQSRDDGLPPVFHDVAVPGGTPANVGNGGSTFLPLGGATSFQVLANITDVQQLVDVQIRIEVGGSEHQTGQMTFTGAGAAWTFTVTSVEAGRAYTLTIEALDRVGQRSTFGFIVATS